MKKEYRRFDEVRKFTHTLNLKGQKEWFEYCKSGNKPDDIPSLPSRTYKNKGWISWGDFLGTMFVANYNRQYRSFEDARRFACGLNLKNYKEWQNYCKSNNIPDDMSRAPDQKYKDEWVSWGDFLGTRRIATNLRIYRGFEDTKEFAHSLKLKNANDWRRFCKSDRKPDNISSHPYEIYKDEWVSWGDFLGTGVISAKERSKNFRSFEDARRFVQSLNLKTIHNWKEFCKSDRKPDNIPSAPWSSYQNKGWTGIKDFLGTDFVSFEDARVFARSLNLKTLRDWNKFCVSDKKPFEIPTTPQGVYKKDWKGWGDWLGTGNVASVNKKFRTFNESRVFARSLNLKNSNEWHNFCKLNKNPEDIPRNPQAVYKNKGWISIGDWLGTGSISSVQKSKNYLPFKEARIIARGLAKKYNIQTWEDWKKAYLEGKIPKNIPNFPDGKYSKKRLLREKGHEK
jgi:hypothetical protein